MGYYPVSLFVGNQSVFSTLGDHADHIGFSGEVLTPMTLTAELPPTWAAVILLRRAGPGLAQSSRTDSARWQYGQLRQLHFNSGSRLGQLCLRRWSRSRLRSLRQGFGESQWQLPGA